MCGLVTIFHFGEGLETVNREELLATRDHMARRGPDGAGEWVSADGRVGMGHRRLAIIDLSERAAQPMHSYDNRYHVVLNGEIYNYRELKQELYEAGYRFFSSSDTEVIMCGYHLWGADIVHHLRGMFAFVLFDEMDKSLFAARDPYGIKPLYYTTQHGVVRVASQVKALLAGGGVSTEPSPEGTVGFYLWGAVPEPYTMYRDIVCLGAGSTLFVDNTGLRQPARYWSPRDIYSDVTRSTLGFIDACQSVRESVKNSVRYHLEADVPVGVFLSAGIDSTVLTALAVETNEASIRSVCLAFDEFRNTPADESVIAARTAAYYGTQHTTVTISKCEFQQLLPDIFASMDQPSIDGINTWLVARAAAQAGMKVAMSGIGGDELFGGYSSFVEVPKMVMLFALPSLIPGVGTAFEKIVGTFPLKRRKSKLQGLGRYAGTTAGAYFVKRGLFMPWEIETLMDPDFAAKGLAAYNPIADVAGHLPTGGSFEKVAALEQSMYLRNQLLRDADWAGMAHSLEIRVPFVDATLTAEIVAHTAGHYSVRRPKQLLAAAARPLLPKEIYNRKKSEFCVPVDTWLKDLYPEMKEQNANRAFAKIVTRK